MCENTAAVSIPPDSELPAPGSDAEAQALEASILPADDAENAAELTQAPDSTAQLDGQTPEGEGATE